MLEGLPGPWDARMLGLGMLGLGVLGLGMLGLGVLGLGMLGLGMLRMLGMLVASPALTPVGRFVGF
jgi:hypothetical protein